VSGTEEKAGAGEQSAGSLHPSLLLATEMELCPAEVGFFDEVRLLRCGVSECIRFASQILNRSNIERSKTVSHATQFPKNGNDYDLRDIGFATTEG
jgi:hypothetical protein